LSLAAGLLLGAMAGGLLLWSLRMPWWPLPTLLLPAAVAWLAWRGRNDAPRLAAPLTHTEPPPPPALPRLVWEGHEGLELATVEVAGGEFLMGSAARDDLADEDERPQHRVGVSGFRIARTPVTAGLYARVGGQAEPADPQRPVTEVSWQAALRFCNRLSDLHGHRRCYRRAWWAPWRLRCVWSADGYRLPTEAEWEYACRAGTSGRWSFGDDEGRLGNYAWFKGNSDGRTHTVAGKRPNPWGLYDMHGNVWELCGDHYGDYRAKPAQNPRGPRSDGNRVFRGGSSWFTPGVLRCACRGVDLESWRWDRGFRCVRVPARRP